MEIHRSAMAFLKEDGKMVCPYKPHREDEYENFDATTQCSTRNLASRNLAELDDVLWPAYRPSLTQAPDSLPPNSYEVQVGEVLRKNPQPNIVRYLGCVVKGGKIRGPLLAKYAEMLYERWRTELALPLGMEVYR
ncbi:uncharacterized protein BCR38DRAFT_490518 [Pseudomassariella vexata]|uniref:Uncharacterized protein n=1 Tax=Pseudomassariella vexata TaxID=1141098 RepID=A0A1Y2DBI6_9PEZI|nr:uncharacterized protein BCR38DRAFT_490518 [Pseudomassariella vexata]ORY56629.1 hypothetical protein BCR38DRAFT_490518 [Pseudomassariella vexata]